MLPPRLARLVRGRGYPAYRHVATLFTVPVCQLCQQAVTLALKACLPSPYPARKALPNQVGVGEYIIFMVDSSHPIKPKALHRTLGFFHSSTPQEIPAHDESHRQARLAMVQQCCSCALAPANRLCPHAVPAAAQPRCVLLPALPAISRKANRQ